MGNTDDQLELQWGEQRAGLPTQAPNPEAPYSLRSKSELQLEQAQYLARYLNARTGLKVKVHVSRAKVTMVSMQPNRQRTAYNLRINPMFLSAPTHIHEVLAQWIREPNASKHHKALEQYIRENQDKIVVHRPAQSPLRTLGVVYDLEKLRDEVNARHFEGKLEVPITWGRMPRQRKRRSIRFGSYVPRDHLIRIHPLLDQTFVPAYFIRYIVFHEMLHAKLGIQHKNGRRIIHSAEFNRMERAYPDYERATAWMQVKENLQALLNG